MEGLYADNTLTVHNRTYAVDDVLVVVSDESNEDIDVIDPGAAGDLNVTGSGVDVAVGLPCIIHALHHRPQIETDDVGETDGPGELLLELLR